MKHDRNFERVFFIVFFLVCAAQSSFARALDAAELEYEKTREDLAFDLNSKNRNAGDVLSVSLTCPPPVTVSCVSQVPPDDFAFGLVTSSCPGNITVVNLGDVITNQICPNNYIITRTYQATDVCLNTATCIQVITVMDNIVPIITCPTNITLSCSEDTSPSNTGLATSIDNCDTNPSINFADMFIPGSCTNGGTIQRTWAVEDNCGNSSTCVQSITIVDIDPPVILACPPDIILSCSDDTSPASTGIATAVDNCDTNPSINFADMFIPGVCTNGGSIQRTFTAVDECGNTSSCIQFISINDNIPPFISNGPVDISVSASGPSPCSEYVSIGIPTATDNCAQNVMIFNDFNFTADASDVYPEGSTTVTFTATDECGNTTSHSFMVLVSCQAPAPSGMVLQSNGNVGISGYMRLGEASEGAPAIKMKELPTTSTGSNNNSSVALSHGLTASKIISVSVFVESAADQYTPPEYSSALNLRYSFSVSPTDIIIQNNTLPGDCLICSKPVKVLIVYKE